MRLPVHIAFHFLGGARAGEAGVELPSYPGAFIDAVSEIVARVTVVAYDPPDAPAIAEDEVGYVASPDIRVLSLGPKGSWSDYVSRRRRIARVVADASGDWDVVVFRFGNRRAHLVFRANRCPRIVSMIGGHTLTMLRGRGARGIRYAVARVLAEISERRRRSILRSSGITFVNSAELQRQYGREAPSVRFLPTSVRRRSQRYRAEDRLSTDSPRFLVVGMLEARKEVATAIEAFARIRRTMPGARLDVAGIGPDMDALRSLTARLGVDDATTFHGWLPPGDALFQLYRDADVLLHLSRAEGMPKVVWEALAHSVLVVCTPVGGLPEALIDGADVTFVPIASVDAVVEAVHRLAGDRALRRRLLERGAARADETSLEAVALDFVGALADIWPELARPRTGSPT